MFREMISESLRKESKVDAIVVLITSRFFRDATKARVYKHRLKKAGVKVVAIHQETSDDPMGTFTEGIFELIDQYESDINSFHTLKALKENIRQGYFFGAIPKYGFKVVEVYE